VAQRISTTTGAGETTNENGTEIREIDGSAQSGWSLTSHLAIRLIHSLFLCSNLLQCHLENEENHLSSLDSQQREM
jgi:hypothetical protein